MVGKAGIEPASPRASDFESDMYTSSTTCREILIIWTSHKDVWSTTIEKMVPDDRFELPTRCLQNSRSYQAELIRRKTISRFSRELWCAQGDSNSHRLSAPGPEPGVSANSTTSA